MAYVDGFLLPVPEKNLAAYRKLSTAAGKIWQKHGALEYRECVGDDLKIKGVGHFQPMVKAKPSETVVFSWIVYKSRAHRDRVNAKVMKDPALGKMMGSGPPPFDHNRMAYAGFKVIVDIVAKKRR